MKSTTTSSIIVNPSQTLYSSLHYVNALPHFRKAVPYLGYSGLLSCRVILAERFHGQVLTNKSFNAAVELLK